MKRTFTGAFLFFFCLGCVLIGSKAHSQFVLPEALRMDLKGIEQTWRILDKYAKQGWPGWTNYAEIPFRIDYPNGLSLHIGDPCSPGRFRVFDGVTARGKKIYLDDSKLNSLTTDLRLDFAGGGLALGAGRPS